MIFPERTCFTCVHHTDVVDMDGVSSRCHLFDEPIDHEVIAAADCDDFLPRRCEHAFTRWSTRADDLGFLAWSRCCDCGALVTTAARTTEGQIP